MAPELNLSQEASLLVGAELEPGERIEWVGQPIAVRYACRSLPTFLFSLPFSSFVFFWNAGVNGLLPSHSSSHFVYTPIFLRLFGLPFLLIALGMLLSPYWMFRKARRTVYVVTDRRALVLEGCFSSTPVRSFLPNQLGDIRRSCWPDGSGSLILEHKWILDSDSSTVDTGFKDIADVKTVETLVRQLALKAEKPSVQKHRRCVR